MKFVSIKTKLTVAMLSTSIIGMILIFAASYTIARSIILSETLEKTRNFAAYESGIVDGWFSSLAMMMKTVGVDLFSLSGEEHFDIEHAVTLFKSHVDSAQIHPRINGMGIGFSDNTAIFDTGKEDITTYKATERVWYQQAIDANGDVIVTMPYQDFLTGKTIVTLAQYIGKINSLDAVILIDVEMQEIFDVITQLSHIINVLKTLILRGF